MASIRRYGPLQALVANPFSFAARKAPGWKPKTDVELIDYVGSWGPMILGHGHPAVLKAVKKTADNGLSFGAPSLIETELAQKSMRIHAID